METWRRLYNPIDRPAVLEVQAPVTWIKGPSENMVNMNQGNSISTFGRKVNCLVAVAARWHSPFILLVLQRPASGLLETREFPRSED